jgi:hypothetical protein
MTMKPYILAGPAEVGNAFGYWGYEVPEGKFAVVTDGEYANGGRGPSVVGNIYYSSRAAAEAALAKYEATTA